MNHLKEFQKKHGLTPDGIIGKNTIKKMREVFGVFTDAQLAHFLANVHHETGGFTASVENLNYSAFGLLNIFPKYFKSVFVTKHKQGTAQYNAELAKYKYDTRKLAVDFASKPEAIANIVYANRMGNGNEASGDGWKYRGRGALQLTGKDNYKAFSAYVKDPMVINNPELVGTKYYWESALFYFTRNNLWNLMKGNDMEAVKRVRKAVNGGYTGLSGVHELFIKYYKIITG